jgi:hypothetical protein
MFAMDVQWLAIGLGSTVVFVALLIFACAGAAGLADRYLEELPRTMLNSQGNGISTTGAPMALSSSMRRGSTSAPRCEWMLVQMASARRSAGTALFLWCQNDADLLDHHAETSRCG